jgi:hypothetical protein
MSVAEFFLKLGGYRTAAHSEAKPISPGGETQF